MLDGSLALSSMIVAGTRLRQIVEHGEHAVVRLVGRDRRRSSPRCRWRSCRNCRPAATVASMPALSKPKVPYSGLGAAGAGVGRPELRAAAAATSVATRCATGKRGARREQRQSRCFMCSNPSGNLLDRRALPRARGAVGPICGRPTSAIRQATPRYPANAQDGADHAQAGDHRRRGVGQQPGHPAADACVGRSEDFEASSGRRGIPAGCRRSRPPRGRTASSPGWTGRSSPRRSATLPRSAMQTSAAPTIWRPGTIRKMPTNRPMATPRGTERRVKRHRSDCADALAERPQPAAVLDFLAGGRVPCHEPADDGREISHATSSVAPARASSRAPSPSRACRAPSCPGRAQARLSLVPSN